MSPSPASANGLIYRKACKDIFVAEVLLPMMVNLFFVIPDSLKGFLRVRTLNFAARIPSLQQNLNQTHASASKSFASD